MTTERTLADLYSVGPATLRDFATLGVESVTELARQDPVSLYERLIGIRGEIVDICCLDVFTAAIAQARDPDLPDEQSRWWYWSRLRKRESELRG